MNTTGVIQHISAVTFVVHDTARSIKFYEKLGFELLYGGDGTEFSSLKADEAFVNLVTSSEYEHRWWAAPFFGSMAWMRTTGYCANEDYSFSRREIHPGLSVSFTSQIQMGTSSASQSCWLDKRNVRIRVLSLLD